MTNTDLIMRLLNDKRNALEGRAATEQQRHLARPAQGLRRAWLLRVFPPPLTKIHAIYLAGRR